MISWSYPSNPVGETESFTSNGTSDETEGLAPWNQNVCMGLTPWTPLG